MPPQTKAGHCQAVLPQETSVLIMSSENGMFRAPGRGWRYSAAGRRFQAGPMWLAVCLLAVGGEAYGQPPPRFAARLADGTRLEGEELSDWHKAELSPRLGGQALLEPNRPAMWLLDRRLSPGPPPSAFLEMFSGDLLPGEVEAYVGDGDQAVVQHFDYWIVRPLVSLRPPRAVEAARVRVEARFVRRVVWQRQKGEAYEPGTVLLRDGRRLAYRSVRVRGGELSLLLSEGTQRVPFGRIAELHLPAADFWDQLNDELAVLAPDGRTRLLQVETDEGLVATASMDRFSAIAGGSESVSDRWSHAVQPAWSLDLLWVPHDRIRVRRLFAPHQVPLARLPVREQGPSTEEAGLWLWPAQRNRNVRGGPLRCRNLDFGWGFGVHARSRLSFPLPPVPSSLRCEFGLDRIAQSGGWALARIQLEPGRRNVHESPPRSGADDPLSIGPLALPEAQELVLEADPAQSVRKSGSDPFFVRDMADWLDPLLELDTGQWTQRIGQQTARQVPAWIGWQLTCQGPIAWPSRLRESHLDFGSFVRGAEIQNQALLLTRDMELPSATTWLVLTVSRSGARDAKPMVQVRVDDQTIEDREIPYRENLQTEVEPLLFDLSSVAGQAGLRKVEIEQSAIAQQVVVFWEGILLTQQLPMIRPLFEDEGDFVRVGDAAAAARVQNPRYTGARAVRIEPGGEYRLDLARPAAIRERPEWGQFRFLRFALRKADGGRFCLELNHERAADQPARFEAGPGEASVSEAKRVAERLADAWVVITRDLYADFGNLDVSAITVSVPEGEAAILDHIYTARKGNDFQHLPPPAKPDAP